MADLLGLCRLCLARRDAGVDIFTAENDNKSYAEILQDTLQIELLPVDGLSPKACDECIRTMHILEGFRNTILTSQRDLEIRLLDMEIKYEEELVEDESVYEDAAVEVIDDIAEEDCGITEEEISSVAPSTSPLPVLKRSRRRRSVTRMCEPSDYTCDICGKILKNLGTLRNHQKTHLKPEERERNFICDICGKGYDIKSQLTAHSYTHRERRTEKCDQCGKYFLNLKNHIKSTHKKSFGGTCSICHKNVSFLTSHINTFHLGANKVECGVCGKEFRNSKHLTRHMSVHTRVRVKCLFCVHSASCLDNSRSHMRKKHPQEYGEYIQRNKNKLFTERVKEGV